MKVLIFFAFCFLLIVPALTHADDDLVVTVKSGDSLSSILLDDTCSMRQVMNIVKALEALEGTDEGVTKLKGFGIRSGDVAILYPGDKIHVTAIQKWFSGDVQGDSEEAEVAEPTATAEAAETEQEEGEILSVETEEDEADSDDEVYVPLEVGEIEVNQAERGDLDPSIDDEDDLSEPLPEEVLLDSPPEGSEEDVLLETIQDIAETSRSEERGLIASYTFGYSNLGLDAMLLEYFFAGPITSQEFAISHRRSGFYAKITNSVSVAGGMFSDLGDRTNLSAGLQGGSTSFHWSIQHQWVHTNHRMDEWFYYADRHRTSVHLGVSLGLLKPHAFILSDLPAYTPVDEMMLYGGGGVQLTIPISVLNTDIDLGASVTRSLFWYYRTPETRYRLHAGLTTRIGGISFRPEISYLTDVSTGGSMVATSFGVTF